VRVGVSNVGLDGRLKGSDTGGYAPAQLAFGQQRKPAFDQIDPGGAGRREMQREARPLQQPSADQSRFMRPLVVEDQMHVQLRRDCRLNGIEELSELPRSVAVMERPNDAACGDFPGGEERRGAMAVVVMCAAFHLARTHRQQRARPIQGVNLRLLIHTQHQGLVWRMQVEAHNIAYLLDNQGIGRQFEGFRAMRLQAERPPDALHSAATPPALLRHSARTPVGGVGGVVSSV
jgi:hypothetical protein